MTFLKISIPVYKLNKWKNWERDGKIEVSSEVDNLSQGYQDLKNQIDELLHELDAQNRLANDSNKLQDEIEAKARFLKMMTKNIQEATEHYECLKFFLEKLGIDSSAPRLTFDKKFLLREASALVVEVENASNSEKFE